MTSSPCLRHILLVKLVPEGSKQGTGLPARLGEAGRQAGNQKIYLMTEQTISGKGRSPHFVIPVILWAGIQFIIAPRRSLPSNLVIGSGDNVWIPAQKTTGMTDKGVAVEFS